VRKKNPPAEFGVLSDKLSRMEHYEKRFGMIAIDKGYITAEDLVKGLTIQVGEDIRKIPHRFLGEIFFDMGLMTDQQVDEVLGIIFRKSR
jgi:hypothetical protein